MDKVNLPGIHDPKKLQTYGIRSCLKANRRSGRKKSNGAFRDPQCHGPGRYEGRPLATLQSLDSEGRVIYVGSLSKVLFPSLRIAYLVAPPALGSYYSGGRRQSGLLLGYAAVPDDLMEPALRRMAEVLEA